MIKPIFRIILSLILICSCANSHDVLEQELTPSSSYISFGATSTGSMRNFQFKPGDIIGATGYYWVNKALHRQFENVPLLLTEKGWVPHQWNGESYEVHPYKWVKEASHYHFYAYYPYVPYQQGTGQLSDTTGQHRSFTTVLPPRGDQGIHMLFKGFENGKGDDLMVATRRELQQSAYLAGAPPVSLEFKHVFSRLTLTLSKSETLAGKQITPVSLKIGNLPNKKAFHYTHYAFQNLPSGSDWNYGAAYNQQATSATPATVEIRFNTLSSELPQNTSDQLYTTQELAYLNLTQEVTVLEYFEDRFVYPNPYQRISLELKYLIDGKEQYPGQPYTTGYETLPGLAYVFNQVHRLHIVLGKKPTARLVESPYQLSAQFE